MKPVYVRMQAFGPYVQAQTCDFSKLQDSGMFLITGQTGSGKTSILDGICCALYGEATGGLRSLLELRSNRAPSELDTETEYVFELGDRRYKFQRRVQIHQKRNGETEPRQTAACYIWKGQDWELLTTGDRNTAQRAQQIIGLDRERFTQVIVLPQGEFRKLLVAKSREKLELLQTLFSTAGWREITAAFTAKARQLEQALTQLHVRRQTLLDAAGCETPEALDKLVQSTDLALRQAQEASKVSAGALEQARQSYQTAAQGNENYARLNQALQTFATLEQQREQMQQLDIRCKQAQAQRELLLLAARRDAEQAAQNTALEQARQAGQKADAAQSALERAQRAAGQVPQLRQQQEQAAQRQIQLQLLAQDAQALKQTQETLAALEAQLQPAQAQRQQLAQQQTQITRQVQQLSAHRQQLYETWIQPVQQNSAALAQLKQALEYDDQAQALTQQLAQKTTAAAELEATLRQARRAYEAARRVTEQAEQWVSQNTAAALAAQLEQGRPCPVCGSVEHPAPAQPPAQQVPVLAAARENEQRCLTRCNDLAAEYAQAQQELKQLEQQRQEAAQHFADSGLERAEAHTRHERLAAWVQEAARQQSAYEQSQKELAQLQQSLSQIQRQTEENTQQISVLENQISAAQARLQTVREKLPAETAPDTLIQQMQQAQQQADALAEQIQSLEQGLQQAQQVQQAAAGDLQHLQVNLEQARRRAESAAQALTEALKRQGLSEQQLIHIDEQELETLQARVQKYREDYAHQKRLIRELQARLGDFQPVVLDALKQQVDACQEAYTACQQTVGGLGEKAAGLAKSVEELKALAESGGKQEQAFQQYERLARLLAGKNRGKTPIESFVLGLMLDDVLTAANQYLTRFTKGRYALCRQQEPGSGNALSGLDIAVLDGYTGTARGVGTLSGGEMFLASLALALGLAGVVQSCSGGVRMDAVFIDEGFGSLDSDTLDTAMTALEQLRVDGRLVGIISHVSELKSRIGARVEVENGRIRVEKLF